MSCCGSVTYDYSTQGCCIGGRISPSGTFCCGIKFYNRHTHICCNYDQLYIRSNSTECCTKRHTEHNPYSRIYYTVTPYNHYSHKCCSGTVKLRGNHLLCCGSEPYDHKTQICCNGQLRNKIKGLACCRRSFYNRDTGACCSGKLYRKREGRSCCSRTLYNHNTHICCNGIIHPPSGWQ